MTSMIFNR